MPEAFRKLLERGPVVRQHGVGPRVKAPAESRYVQSTEEITDRMQYVRDMRLVTAQVSTIIADSCLAARIECSAGQRWLFINGSRYAAKERLPMALTKI